MSRLLTTGLAFAAAAIGAIIGHLATKRHFRREARDEEQRQMKVGETHAQWPFGSSTSAEHIKFLYDKRLTLFNTRREYEWKIYFGAMVVLGGVDTALLTHRIILASYLERGFWFVACAVVSVAVIGFESQLQIRNAGDREAMDYLYNWLCDLVGIAADSPVREGRNPRKGSLWQRLGWAFKWQALLFLAAAVVSAVLPLILDLSWTDPPNNTL